MKPNAPSTCQAPPPAPAAQNAPKAQTAPKVQSTPKDQSAPKAQSAPTTQTSPPAQSAPKAQTAPSQPCGRSRIARFLVCMSIGVQTERTANNIKRTKRACQDCYGKHFNRSCPACGNTGRILCGQSIDLSTLLQSIYCSKNLSKSTCTRRLACQQSNIPLTLKLSQVRKNIF